MKPPFPAIPWFFSLGISDSFADKLTASAKHLVSLMGQTPPRTLEASPF